MTLTVNQWRPKQESAEGAVMPNKYVKDRYCLKTYELGESRFIRAANPHFISPYTSYYKKFGIEFTVCKAIKDGIHGAIITRVK